MDNDLETGALRATEVEDVFETAGDGANPVDLQEAVTDWDQPIVLIVTKKTRDKYLQILANIAGLNETKDKSTHTESVTEIISGSSKDSLDELNKTRFDMKQAEFLEKRFTQIQKRLNDIQADFHDHELKSNLETAEDTEKFRKARKELTNFYVLGHKTVNMSHKIQNGKTDYLLKADLNIIPNRLDHKIVDEAVQKHTE